MACFGEFMPHRIAGGGRKGKVHKDNIRVQFCMLYFAWEQHLFLLSFSSEANPKPRGPPDVLHFKKIRNGGHLNVRMDQDQSKGFL